MQSSLNWVSPAKTLPPSTFLYAKTSTKLRCSPSSKTQKNLNAFALITWNKQLPMPVLKPLPNLKDWKSSALTSASKSLQLDCNSCVSMNLKNLVCPHFPISKVKFWPKSSPDLQASLKTSIFLLITPKKSTIH